MFHFYDKDMNQQLSKEEWLKLMEDEQVNTWVKHWIDSLVEVSQEQVDEQDQKGDAMVKYDENDYLAYSRLAKSAQHHHPNHKHYKQHYAKKLRRRR